MNPSTTTRSGPASFVPGTATAVVAPSWSALLEAPDDHPLAVHLAALADPAAGGDRGDDVDAIVRALASVGIAALPSLGIAIHVDGGIVAITRGAIQVRAVSGDDEHVAQGPGVTTWAEQRIAGARTYAIDGVDGLVEADVPPPPPPPSPVLRCWAGVTTAARIERALTVLGRAAPVGDDTGVDAAVGRDGIGATGLDDAAAAGGPDTEDGGANRGVPSNDGHRVGASDDGATGDDAAGVGSPYVDDGGGHGDGDRHPDGLFAHLLGETVYRGPEMAAVRPPSEADADLDPTPPDDRAAEATGDPADDDAGPALPDGPVVEDTRSYETSAYHRRDPPLIEQVPGLAPSPAPASAKPVSPTADVPAAQVSTTGAPGAEIPVARAPQAKASFDVPVTGVPVADVPIAGVPVLGSSLPDHVPAEAPRTGGSATSTPSDVDEPTLSVQAVRVALAGGEAPVVDAPLVQAVHCPQRHASPPHAGACRTCGAPIHDRAVTTVARPSLGTFVFDDGSSTPLTSNLLVGRKPRLGAEGARSSAAELVALDDPEQLLSRTHIEVRLVDWQVQVVDLGSMNHTYVDAPGQPTIQLLPHEPCSISPGTRIILGDATAFTYHGLDASPAVGR